VVGCAACVWDDVKEAKRICGELDAVYCVKQVGIHWPSEFQVWVTLHPEFMDAYERERQALGHPSGYEIVAPPEKEVGMHGKKGRIARRVSYRWEGMNSSASSGVYAVKVAMEDHPSARIVLAGVPMTPEGGHFLPKTRNGSGQIRGPVWTQHASFVCGLGVAMPTMLGRVRSVSGYTEKMLGRPDEAWLSGTAETEK